MSCPRDACPSEYTRSEIERTCPASTSSETTATSTKETNGIKRIIYTSVSYSGIVAERIASQIRNFEIVNWTVGDAKSNLILSNFRPPEVVEFRMSRCEAEKSLSLQELRWARVIPLLASGQGGV